MCARSAVPNKQYVLVAAVVDERVNHPSGVVCVDLGTRLYRRHQISINQLVAR